MGSYKINFKFDFKCNNFFYFSDAVQKRKYKLQQTSFISLSAKMRNLYGTYKVLHVE